MNLADFTFQKVVHHSQSGGGLWAGSIDAGLKKESPVEICIIPAINSPVWPDFKRKPRAPAASICLTVDGLESLENASTRTPGEWETICRVASMPSIPGMDTSINTTSGLNSAASFTAEAESAASPTISKNGTS